MAHRPSLTGFLLVLATLSGHASFAMDLSVEEVSSPAGTLAPAPQQSSAERVLKMVRATLEARRQYNVDLANFFGDAKVPLAEKLDRFHVLTGRDSIEPIDPAELSPSLKQYGQLYEGLVKRVDGLPNSPEVQTAMKKTLELLSLVTELKGKDPVVEATEQTLGRLAIELWIAQKDERRLRKVTQKNHKQISGEKSFQDEEDSGYSEVPALRFLFNLVKKELDPWWSEFENGLEIEFGPSNLAGEGDYFVRTKSMKLMQHRVETGLKAFGTAFNKFSPIQSKETSDPNLAQEWQRLKTDIFKNLLLINELPLFYQTFQALLLAQQNELNTYETLGKKALQSGKEKVAKKAMQSATNLAQFQSSELPIRIFPVMRNYNRKLLQINEDLSNAVALWKKNQSKFSEPAAGEKADPKAEIDSSTNTTRTPEAEPTLPRVSRPENMTSNESKADSKVIDLADPRSAEVIFSSQIPWNEIRKKFSHKRLQNKFDLFFDDRRNHVQFSREDIENLYTAVGGKVFPAGKGFHLVLPGGGSTYVHMPHKAGHALKLDGTRVRACRKPFEDAGITPGTVYDEK